MPIQNKDTLAASVPTPPLGSTTLFTDAGLLKTKDDTGSVITLAAGGTVTSVGITGSQGITSGGGPITTSGSITVGLGNITPVTVSTGNTTIAGNLLFTGNSRRIQGEFSGATIANRTMFQTSQVNGNTNLSIIPNGTGTSVFFNAENSSSPLNNSFAQFAITATEARVMSDVRGAGTQLPLHFIVGATRVMAMTPEFNVVLGHELALVPSATDGFVYIRTISGTPTGIPTAYTGAAAQVIDATNNKLYFYSGGSWRDSTTGGTVTTVSVTTANGVSGSVATASTTPAITLTLGAITPSSVSSTGDVSVETAGNGLKIKEGSNAKMGVATLVGGTLVVSTTAVTANSRIFLTAQVLGTITVPAALAVSARTAATSFTILSSNVLDTSDVAWMIVEPA